MRILIVGAGIIGMTCAYKLNKEGYRVEVIEKEDNIGKGISSSNAGVLHIIQQPFKSVKSKLCLVGAREYRELAHVIGFEIYETSLNIVGFNIIDKAYLHMVASYLRRYGYKVQHLDKPVTDDTVLSKDIKHIIRIDGYGVVDPDEVLNKLYQYISDQGVEVFTNTKEFNDGEYDVTVVAAGLESYELGEKLGDKPPSHKYALGAMVKVDVETSEIYTLPPSPFRKYTKGGASIPKKGYTLLGPGFKWVNNLDYTPKENDFQEVYTRFRPIFREPPKIIDAFYGIRPINYPKDDFIIRKRGKYIFTYGIDSPGFTAAPALASVVTSLVRVDKDFIEVDVNNLERYLNIG